MTAEKSMCPLCGSPRIAGIPFGYQFNGGWLSAIECRTCSIIFIDPQPTASELAGLYSSEYFEGDFRCGHEGSYFDEANLSKLVDDTLLSQIKSVRSNGRFLEIGCAGGALLDAARSLGYEVQGVEFSPVAAEFARKHFRLPVVTGDLLDAKLPSSIYDVVFMGDVLEHLPDPMRTLGEINRVMAQGGLLVIHCPMQTNTIFSRMGFLAYRLAGRTATVHLPPYHLFEYRPASMKYLLERTGFRVKTLQQTTIPPGNIAQRGSFLQKSLKKLFQYPNAIITSTLQIFGDRIQVMAMKAREVNA